MKNFLAVIGSLLFAVIAVLPVRGNTVMNDAGVKIMVISDPHLLAPSLTGEGKAAQQLAAGDMKLVLESDLIVGRMVDEIIKEKPQLLLITGDLTFNGARASHERLVSHLERLEKAGVRTFVIPGNHDVNCPYSKSYAGEVTEPVATVSSEEFAQLYLCYGYGKDSKRDPNSLSYICEPVEGLMLLCIDSNRYNENRLGVGGEKVVYHNEGVVKPETLEWIKEQLDEAKAGGKRVIALMHHHLVEHIDGEAKLLPNYIVANHEEVAKVLRDGGVKVVFTGHLHITDAATIGVTDVATGSASTYPLPMRTVTVSPGRDTLSIETRFFDGLDEELLQRGRQQVENSAEVVARMISRKLWPKINGRMDQLKQMLEMQEMEVSKLPQNAQELSDLLVRHLREPLTKGLLEVSRGNENARNATVVINGIKQGVKGMMVELLGDEGEMMAEFLIDEMFPRVEPMLKSALEDVNHVGASDENRTDDHVIVVKL
jgi:3',5'-cyclic AMP phosphodiesterase CpdA